MGGFSWSVRSCLDRMAGLPEIWQDHFQPVRTFLRSSDQQVGVRIPPGTAPSAIVSGLVKIIDAPRRLHLFFLMPAEAISRHEQDLAFVQRFWRPMPPPPQNCAAATMASWSASFAPGRQQTEAEDLVADLWTDSSRSPDKSPDVIDQYQAGVPSSRGSLRWQRTGWSILNAAELSGGGPRCFRDSPRDFSIGDRSPSRPGARNISWSCCARRSSAAFATQSGADSDAQTRASHQLSQREIARMWGWHESKVSRRWK